MNKKRWLILAGVIVFVALCITLVFFQGEKKDTEVKIGLILTGSCEEGGWNQAHYDAMKQACETQFVELLVKENIAEGTGACIPVIDEMAAAGANMIFLSGYAFGKEVAEYADTYPDIAFFHVDGAYVGDNVSSYFGRMYQARYLSGIVAASMSEEGKLGYVAAMETPEVVRGINAFTLGARSVNPEAEVYVKWVGSWNDEAKEIDLATELVKENQVDVLAYHENKTSVVDVAEENGIYSIGYHFDDAARYSDHYLTAAVWDFEPFFEDRIRDYVTTGKVKGESYWTGVMEGTVKLSAYSALVPQDVKDEVEDVTDSFAEGWDVFSGPIYDMDGKLRVEDGEQISDEYLQTEIDWLVQGVILE